MNMPTRIGIVDPQEIVRNGLSILLNNYEEFSVIGQARDIDGARHLCSVYNPHILIIDFFCEGEACIQALQKIQEEFPNIQLFILTNRNDRKIIDKVIKIGVLGYWFKDVSLDDLTRAIRSVCNNQPSLAPEALRSIIHSRVSPHQVGYDLTERQHDVLKLLVKGLKNREIADILLISYSTVKNHVSTIFSKLEISNRVKAATVAIENDLVNA